MKKSILFLLFITPVFSLAQDKKSDQHFIKSHVTGQPQQTDLLNTKTVLSTKHTNVLARYNPVTLTLKGMMLIYQHAISQQLSATCVYSRSCSNFSKQAIAEFGIIKGVFLTADRLMRCNHSCENDFPGYAFTADGKITDEPSAYKRK